MRDNAKFDYYKVDFDLIIIRSVWDNFLRKLQSSKFVIPLRKKKCLRTRRYHPPGCCIVGQSSWMGEVSRASGNPRITAKAPTI